MIHQNLQTLRKTRRFTQEQVAERVGVSRQAVAKWEAGETVPDVENCIALAKLYGVTLDTLVAGDSEAPGGLPPRGKHIFGTATLGERGQIVIPKKARDVFGLRQGDELVVLGDEESGIALVRSETFLRALELARDMARADMTDTEEAQSEK